MSIKIYNGDLLLFRRGRGLISRLISVAGRSEISHAGMAVWLDRRDCRRFSLESPGLYCAHTVEGRGGRLDLLADLVAERPGAIKLRKPGLKYDRRKAKAQILKIVGKPYGLWAVRRAMLIHLAIVRVVMFRWLWPFMANDGDNGTPPFCSMAVARVCRAAGLDPVPNLADAWTEPGDLDRSAAFEDVAWLTPEDFQ